MTSLLTNPLVPGLRSRLSHTCAARWAVRVDVAVNIESPERMAQFVLPQRVLLVSPGDEVISSYTQADFVLRCLTRAACVL